MKHLAILVSLLLPACSPSGSEVLKRSGEPDVITVSSEDAAVNAAIEKARSTLSSFQKALESTPADAEGFAVKVGFRHSVGDGQEHIWLLEPSFSDGMVAGVVNNEPVNVTTLKLGQHVSVPVGEISDWMFVQGGVLHGGYTIRALLEKESPEERARCLAEWGFRLE
ncbi:MAG TPA: DUF2314 domain-containing protein [Polyangiaceae bacterium]|nr:DUF2314 domain-containing protein [Polyangiaceae bacterium]